MKNVSLACTGGGIKACVNIGVLRALEDLNIEITALSGASMGAIIALLYSCNYSPKEILNIFETKLLKFQKFSFANKICAIPSLVINGGATRPKKIEKILEDLFDQNHINLMKDISKPLIIPALDISAREIIYYSSKELHTGNTCYYDRKIIEAIRSSSAVPLLYTPNKVEINGINHFMLDGGIMTNTLVQPLKQFSDFVIGVSTKFYPKQRKRVNLFTGFVQTFQSMRRSHFISEKFSADLWIEPDLGSNKFIDSAKKIKYYEQLRLWLYYGKV